MVRKVFCQFLNKEAEGLDSPPAPGEIGQRIYENISAEAWKQWLQRLAIIINENRLSTADQGAVEIIEKHMVGFLFKEGEFGDLPSGFMQQGARK